MTPAPSAASLAGLAPRVRNLLAVPSQHFEPLFAQAARQAFGDFRPSVVAVEAPAALAPAVDEALTAWPRAVGLLARGVLWPLVPGDSIVEAWRLARDAGIPVVGVDLLVAGPGERTLVTVPGPDLARSGGALFRKVTAGILDAAGPPSDGDLAREAHMARRLAALMAEHARVLWVGGLAHWGRLAGRIEAGDFEAPAVEPLRVSRPRLVRLAPSAILRLTGRIPALLAAYAVDPDRYDESAAIRRLALDALRQARRRPAGAEPPGAGLARAGEVAAPGGGTAADVARALLYARNLAASRRLTERPTLGELLTAASATLGNRYAGWLSRLVLREPAPGRGRAWPVLAWVGERRARGFAAAGRRIRVTPRWAAVASGVESWVPGGDEATRRVDDRPYRHVPRARADDTFRWKTYPPDEEAYEAYVGYVLRQVAAARPGEEPVAAPIVSGVRDGLDVRATIRHWPEGDIYVREGDARRLAVTNGIIDYSSAREGTAIHLGRSDRARFGGWNDPSCRHVGSVSREVHFDVVQERPCQVTRRRRELSMITLDATTSVDGDERQSFYRRVIDPLVHLAPRDDYLYTWLEVMFRFCRGKRVAYYSRYVPGPRVHAVARRHRVEVLHVPLGRIPPALLARHRCFRLLWLTRPQWDALLERIPEGRRAWVGSERDAVTGRSGR